MSLVIKYRGRLTITQAEVEKIFNETPLELRSCRLYQVKRAFEITNAKELTLDCSNESLVWKTKHPRIGVDVTLNLIEFENHCIVTVKFYENNKATNLVAHLIDPLHGGNQKKQYKAWVKTW